MRVSARGDRHLNSSPEAVPHCKVGVGGALRFPGVPLHLGHFRRQRPPKDPSTVHWRGLGGGDSRWGEGEES